MPKDAFLKHETLDPSEGFANVSLHGASSLARRPLELRKESLDGGCEEDVGLVVQAKYMPQAVAASRGVAEQRPSDLRCS